MLCRFPRVACHCEERSLRRYHPCQGKQSPPPHSPARPTVPVLFRPTAPVFFREGAVVPRLFLRNNLTPTESPRTPSRCPSGPRSQCSSGGTSRCPSGGTSRCPSGRKKELFLIVLTIRFNFLRRPGHGGRYSLKELLLSFFPGKGTTEAVPAVLFEWKIAYPYLRLKI